ncbi:treacle protein isoform X2 [Tiliqua scincoides]|uniref:treacle protein isoform X2 n=1 Tax=Tiliqua scincoides TaxID=71010 RepID=UPI0034631FB8
MAAAGGEQRDLLALIHQHLVQVGYSKAARELLLQSGQKNFPPSPVLLRDIFTQWKKTSLQSQKQIADDLLKRDALAKFRVPDPKSSSESEEEEVAKPTASNLSVNNRSTAKAESSSEDEDSSSEEEAVAEKTVKTLVAGNKTANFLQLAAEKSNSVPGKGVAVAAVQAKGKLSKAVSSKQPLPAVAKTKEQNKVLSGKPGPLILAGKSPAQAAAAKKASSSESSSDSSSSESEEEKTPTIAKPPAPTQALKKTESSSEDSSDDSEEEATNTPAVQAKLLGRTPQAFASPVKNAPSALLSKKVVHTPTPLKQADKPSGTGLKKPGLLSPTKTAETARDTESSESSSSESETSPVPISQKRLQTPRPPTAARQSQADKSGPLVKAASSALKGKESSSSSDSEDETVPASLNLPPPPTTKANATVVLAGAKKFQPPSASLQKAQESEDSSEDSSDESDLEEGMVFIQKPAQVTQKPGVVPAKTLAVKAAGAKAGSVQSAGKGTTSSAKLAAASLQKEPESSETDSSDSSESKEDGKQAKQPPSHPFLKQQTLLGNAATPSGKGLQSNSTVSDSVSSKDQGKGPALKVAPNSSKKATVGQGPAQAAKHAGILNRKESSGSSSSSDSEEEETAALTTARQIAQPGVLQKQGAIKKAESSSEESSDEDLEPSQSLLTGYQGLLKTPTPATPRNAASMLSKQTSGKATSTTATPVVCAFAKSSEKAPICDSSSSDSSDSDTDAEETPARQKPGLQEMALFFSGRDAVVAKKAVGAQTVPGSIGKPAPPAKKARKAQSNGRAKGATAKSVQMLSVVPPEGVGSKSEEEAVTQVSSAGAQGDTPATPHKATKAQKTPKASKAGAMEKPPKKRKLATGAAGLGEPKRKKLKGQSGLEVPKKKKKKSKSSSGTNTPKKKEGKEKKSNKKKKKNKELKSPTSKVSQKKKKKKKKTGDVEGTA